MMFIRKVIVRLRGVWQSCWVNRRGEEHDEAAREDQHPSEYRGRWGVLAPDDRPEEPVLTGVAGEVIQPKVFYIDERGNVVDSSVPTMRLEYGYIAPSELVLVGGE